MHNREDKMVVLTRDADGTPTTWCDPEIVDLVTVLNTNGLRTVASCSGHGHRPGFISLQDGRVLLVCASLDEARKADSLWPDINGEFTRHGAGDAEEGSLRFIAKRNLRRMIETGSTETKTMLLCLEELS